MAEELINGRELLKEKNKLNSSIERVLAELEILKSDVEGSVRLRAIKHGNEYQYFQRRKGSETNGEYIRKKDVNKAITLAQIEYDERLFHALQEEKKTLEKYESAGNFNPFGTVLEQMSPGKRKLVKPHYVSDEDYLKKWREQEYDALPYKEDFPDYYTRHGIRVRSKSEVLIADTLDELSIPFLYEKPLCFRKRTVHPDFTLLNVKERKEVYWEHFGMMDDREYRDDALMKIREYEANGYYQFDSAIWTFESSKYPMSTKEIRNMIKTLRGLLGY